MTAQLTDRISYLGEDFSLIAIEHEPLFDPAACGLQPKPCSTDCYRGYFSTMR